MTQILRADERLLSRPASALPVWPVTVPLLTYPLWWMSGIGELALVPFAGCAAFLLMRNPWSRVPRGIGAWLVMLLWVVASLLQIDTGGRLIGAGYRLLLYAAVTVFIVYIFNVWSPRTQQRICGAMAVFLFWMTAGAIAGLLVPLFELRTPLVLLIPDALLGNELVQEMVYRRLTQYDPNAWNADVMSPRPSFPFLYTNGWGNSYSLILPFVLLYASQAANRTRTALVLLLVVVSTVPAALTLNRGMVLGLAVGLLYFLARGVATGRRGWLVGAAVFGAFGTALLMFLPIQERLEARNASTGSTVTRLSLYEEAWERTTQSPVLGYGAPRPSIHADAPSVGTQGQFWATMFSHGFFAAIALVAWLLVVAVVSMRRADALHVACGAVAVMALTEVFYYGFIPFGFLWVGVAAAFLFAAQQRAGPELSSA